MVNDHSDSERGNPLAPHWLLFPTRVRQRQGDRKIDKQRGRQRDDNDRDRDIDRETTD